MTTNSEVSAYYDEFTQTRFSTYSPGSNKRIEMAINRILSNARPGVRILEIGCGVGIVTERLHDCIPEVRIWACDTSAEAIRVAAGRFQSDRLDFKRFDVLEEFDAIREWVAEPVDLVVLVDVIEHIPQEKHEGLLQDISSWLHQDGKVIMTYPSPQYQEHLKSENREELQIIDETITATDLARVTESAGLTLRHYSLEDVWVANQYVHCILSGSSPLARAAGRRERLVSNISQQRIRLRNSRTLSGHYGRKVTRKILRTFRTKSSNQS